MNMLTEAIENTVLYQGRSYRVCCSFDNVLEVQRMYRDSRLTELDKVCQAVSMLTESPFKVWLLNPMQRAGLLDQITKEQIVLPKRPKMSSDQTRTLDFAEDSDYIFASFMQAYGLDLVDLQRKLHWRKFIALFQGLPDKTKIKEVMRIRGMEIPAPTKHNQKEIKNLMELKAYYALGYRENNGKEGLDRLFATLERMV